MVIEIDDKNFGCDNFEYEILINHKITSLNINEKGSWSIEANQNDIVEIKAKNVVFSSRYGYLFMFIYWIVSVLTGSGENNPFGKPFDAYIQLKIKSTYVKLKANKIWKNNSFIIVSGEADVEKNVFLFSKKYIKRWFFGIVIPINLLIIAIMCMFVFSGAIAGSVIIKILFCLFVFGLLGWNLYVFLILKRINHESVI